MFTSPWSTWEGDFSKAKKIDVEVATVIREWAFLNWVQLGGFVRDSSKDMDPHTLGSKVWSLMMYKNRLSFSNHCSF